jgi:hypothetical protein
MFCMCMFGYRGYIILYIYKYIYTYACMAIWYIGGFYMTHSTHVFIHIFIYCEYIYTYIDIDIDIYMKECIPYMVNYPLHS